MAGLQELIYKLEEGGGAKWVRSTVALLLIVGVGALYNYRCYRNFETPDAMDNAQLARNIAQGKGFTTDFIKPFDVFLLQEQMKRQGQDEKAVLKGPVPDIANPPLYPVLVAGLFKLLPESAFEINETRKEPFTTHRPEWLVTGFNQLLFAASVGFVFLIARKLFDLQTGWLSAAFLVGGDIFWRFTVSGLNTNLLVLLFLVLTWLLLRIEAGVSGESKSSPGSLLMHCFLAGLVLGLGMLTRYSFGFFVLPVAAFLLIWARPVRIAGPVVAVVTMLLVFSPWAVRNIQVVGNPFGSAAYSVLEETSLFPGETLPRSLDFRIIRGSEGTVSGIMGFGTLAKEVGRKLTANLREIVQKDVPGLGSSWVIAFFLPGLLLSFMNPSIGRLRWFLLMTIPVALLVHAGSKSFRGSENPEVNGDAFLILIVPMIMVFGAGFFMVLLDQIILPFRQLRYAIQAGAVSLFSLALILHLMPPRTVPVAYPPYFPPLFSQIGKWMRPEEMVMSDVPWAIAWYGGRKSMWLTLDSNEDFYFVNDSLKTVALVYVTPRTLDAKFHSGMWKQTRSWGRFVSDIFSRGEVPTGFPLRKVPPGFLESGQLLLSDWERWRGSSQ